jgi:hypothetical protein
MVKNSTNINKTNNHLHSLNTKKTTTYDVRNPDPAFGQANKCDGVKLVNGITTLMEHFIGLDF